jgi:hypothetical protein
VFTVLACAQVHLDEDLVAHVDFNKVLLSTNLSRSCSIQYIVFSSRVYTFWNVVMHDCAGFEHKHIALRCTTGRPPG